MKIINIPADQLIPYENNPRNNSSAVDAVANSILEFGFLVPVVIDHNNVIAAGHTRLLAAKKLRLREIPCVRADDLTEEQIRAFRLADNKTAELASWDFVKLDLEMSEIHSLDMADFGFPTDDDEQEDPEISEGDYDGSTPENARAKIGDLYQLGDHRLICGDSTDITVIDRLMGDEIPHMIYTDPPYGMHLDTDYSSMECKISAGGHYYDQGSVDDFSPDMINTVFTIDADEVFLWGADYYAELLPDRNDGSWIVWDKRSNNTDDVAADESSDRMYGSCFELCWSKQRHKRDIARIKWAGIFGMDQEHDHQRVHPTQKPVKLAAWFLDRFSQDGDIILDLFGGSGSTLLACEQLNRKCYMCELDPHYVDVIINRWESLTGEKAILLGE